ncbi:MAG: LysM peptidoglycan-binding domain-containing protein [Vulcanococcus sp.]|uniref:LysM peptidoglycan-binding domain-containing protein n=1 Tax=Vulcanococcus sp. TaxID=2856995 RepID=UPI0025DA2DF9|nr:LysM peptidoglycan-binding domain-containing protein [Vulcanococcus sp.]MBW0165938.1 LysM peptidoglycan-binding domain-containing protein [Vulcanococcus sp.]
MRRRSAAALALALLLPLPGLAGDVVVKPGETLSEIAERYGTSVQRLMQLNNLRSPQDLWAGSRIQVPGAAGSSASRGGGSGNYTVKPGETLSEIAERYGTSVQRLMQLNNLRSPQDLWAGSRIQVPGATAARPSGGGGGTRTTTVSANYTVKPGETLSELAERYGTSVQRLMELNNLRGPQDLWAGSRIQVPITRTTAAAPKPAVNKNATQHKVQSGETLSVIADRYGVSMQNLIALNGISNPNQVEVGRTLKLRGTPKPAAKPAAAKPAPKPQTVAAKPAAKPAPQPAAKPAAQPVAAKPVAAQPVVAQPAASPAPAAAAPVAAKPEPKPAAEAAAPVAAKPEPKPAAKPATTTVAAKPAAAASSSKPGKPASPDWRNYGPLQVDWANWQPMGGSYVAPSLNSDGQPLYLAINCNAKRLNATGQSGTWKTWDAPQSDFEHKLINDLCTAKGG